jgi:hypothetical protein
MVIIPRSMMRSSGRMWPVHWAPHCACSPCLEVAHEQDRSVLRVWRRLRIAPFVRTGVCPKDDPEGQETPTTPSDVRSAPPGALRIAMVTSGANVCPITRLSTLNARRIASRIRRGFRAVRRAYQRSTISR